MERLIGVCTRNRPEALARLIKSLNSTNLNEIGMIVCDSSDLEFVDLIKNIVSNFQGKKTIYLSSIPGVSIQRNIILNYAMEAKTKYLYFLDDDIEISQNYFEVVDSYFEKFKNVSIVGTKIANLPKSRLIKKFQGKLQKNGIAQGIYSLNGPQFVDWVPGLSMSLKVGDLTNTLFDESRERNSLGEDIDFCTKVCFYSKILWIDAAHVFHHSDPYGRYNSKKQIYSDYYHRFLLLKDFKNRLYRSSVLFKVFSEILSDFLRICLRSEKKFASHILIRFSFLWYSRLFDTRSTKIVKIMKQLHSDAQNS
jgi:glycosyltransferase involved in cell wall biosynthesis